MTTPRAAASAANSPSLKTKTQVGLLVAGHGRHAIVEAADGQRLICHPRGKKSQAVVGDRVRWMRVSDDGGGTDGEGVIEELLPRRNLLFRQDAWKNKSFAANLDQLLVWIAVDPVFSESQLARALIAAESTHIAATIVLNKSDLPAAHTQRDRLAPYRAMGYPVIELSLKARRDKALEVLRPLLAGRSTLVLGPSGTGKSTLVNAVVPDARAQVGEISEALNSGRHTTTSTQWYWVQAPDRAAAASAADPFAGGTALIDSPGFQEFGLQQLSPQDLTGYMPDLKAQAGGCRFYNCSHRHEPGCAVIDAVQRGEISASRWRIHGELTEELSRSKW